MPRDWMRDERDPRRGRADDPRDPLRREDFGQADFSTDYGYDADRREGYRSAEEIARRREDYGQADYSTDYVYDPDRGGAYRQVSGEQRSYRGPDAAPDERVGERGRSWLGRPGLRGRDESDSGRRRRGPSDRVLWAVIVERLEDVRGLDLHDVEVLVDNAEVTLNGTVRRKEDKRRIEDIADLDGVRHVQNNLRVREGGLRRWF